MDTKAAAEAAQKRIAETVNRSAGQHLLAIRRAFAAARERLVKA